MFSWLPVGAAGYLLSSSWAWWGKAGVLMPKPPWWPKAQNSQGPMRAVKGQLLQVGVMLTYGFVPLHHTLREAQKWWVSSQWPLGIHKGLWTREVVRYSSSWSKYGQMAMEPQKTLENHGLLWPHSPRPDGQSLRDWARSDIPWERALRVVSIIL
jgi:hypothetical protein